jgi:hypothetical protein
MMKSGEQRQLREALTEAMAIHRDYQSMGLERYYRVSEIHHDEVEGFSLVTSDRQRFVLGLEDYPEKLYRLADVLDHLQRNGSPVEVIRLDNEQQPWRVAAAGTRIEFKNRRVLPVISDAGRALLP